MATGDQLLTLGSSFVWTNSGGDEVLDLGAPVAAGGVRVGAYHDWGGTPRASMYRLAILINGFNTAPVIGAQVLVYISEASSITTFTGPESPADTADGAGNINRLPNLLGPFPLTVWSTTAANNLRAAYTFFSPARYHAPVVHNATAQTLLSTADAHTITITPLWHQMQP